MLELARAQLDEVGVGAGPQLVALVHKYSSPRHVRPSCTMSGDHVRSSGCARPARRGRGCRSSCRGSSSPRGRRARRSGSRGSAARWPPRSPRRGGGGSMASQQLAIGIDETTCVAGTRWVPRRRAPTVTTTARPPSWRMRDSGLRRDLAPPAADELGAALPHHAPGRTAGS